MKSLLSTADGYSLGRKGRHEWTGLHTWKDSKAPYIE